MKKRDVLSTGFVSRFITSLALFAVISLSTLSASATGTNIVIAEVYGGGGNTGATYKNDFVVLFNPTASGIDINGWAIYYASTSGTNWQTNVLATVSTTIPAGGYFLVKEAAGTTGGTTDLPTPDATGTIAMSANNGKVALCNDTNGLSGSCGTPTSGGIIDFVGYGTANCSETAAAPGLSNTTSDSRNNNGCDDTYNNSADFTAGAPNPRNSATATYPCGATPDPAISTGPVSQTVIQGNPVTFSVVASGTATLTYQWRKDGANIASATDTAYTIATVQGTDAGTYTVVVTNGVGNSVTSNPAVLTVTILNTNGISMTTGSYSQNFDSLGATNGTWLEDTTLSGWYASQTLPTSPHSVASYTASSGTSGTGALYSFGTNGVNPASDRALGSIGSGTPGNFAYGLRFTNDHATLSRSNIVISYTGEQWRRGDNAAAQTLAFSYRISNGAITSSDAGDTQIWTPFQALDFTTPITGAAAAEPLDGNNAANRISLSATLTNVVVLTNKEFFIRWKDLNDSGTDHGVSIDDVTVTSDGVIATIAAPTITGQPQSRTNNYGTTASFAVSANGTQPFTYQWRKNGSVLTDSGNTVGAFNQTLSVTNVTKADEGSFDVIVANSAGMATSAVATLTVNDPGIFTQPASRTNVAGDTANFFVSATGTSLTYQWQHDGTNIADATAASLNVTNIQSADAGSYSVVLFGFDTLTSSVATLTILPTPPYLLARWDFNATNTLSQTNPDPSVGPGTAAMIGGTNSSGNFAFQSGSFSDAAGLPGPANSGWSTRYYPAQGTGNKTTGVRFNVNTVNYGGILLTWEQRHSSSASKYCRLQYTTDGVNFVDYNLITMATENASGFIFYSADLSGLAGVNYNPNFAFRIVSEFESTAIGTTNANYVGTAGNYSAGASGGTIRFDVVNVFAGPALLASKSGNNIVISWSTNFSGFSLQQRTNLNVTNWLAGPAASIVGSNYQATVSIPPSNSFRFFRLTN